MRCQRTLRIRLRAGLLFGVAVLGAFFGATMFAEKTEEAVAVYRPEKLDQVLNNPYMGFAPDAKGGPYPLPHRLVYSNVTWRELEPVKGEYDFAGFEKRIKLEEWSRQGVKLILRVVLDVPRSSSRLAIPDWLYEETGKDGTWYDADIGKGFSPNYGNEVLLNHHRELIAKLGERYNRDSRIAFIELGSLGHWGEWHTWQDDKLAIPFPKADVTDQYVGHYLSAFPDKHLLMRRPYAITRDKRLGLFNDMFGNAEHTTEGFERWYKEGYKFWLTGEAIPAVPDFWVYAPSGGELADAGEGDKYFRQDTIEETLVQAKNTHLSWLGPSSPTDQAYDSDTLRNIHRFLNTIGYRFRIVSESHAQAAAPGSNLRIHMIWTNEGVAPFYYAWPLELSLADASGSIAAAARSDEDIRTWLPGNKKVVSELRIPSSLPEGEYTLCAAILDPDTDLPGIELAMKGKRQDGRYSLGKVTVKK